jgi:hypothetical protein
MLQERCNNSLYTGQIMHHRQTIPGLQVYFVAPPVVAMKDDIKQYLTERGVQWQVGVWVITLLQHSFQRLPYASSSSSGAQAAKVFEMQGG